MEVSGKIIAVLPMQSGESKTSGNQWFSQEYVIQKEDQYSSKLVFKVFGKDKIEQFGIIEGQYVTVHLAHDANQYNGRWYNDIRAYKVVLDPTRVQPSSPAPTAQAAPAPAPVPVAQPAPTAAPTPTTVQPTQATGGDELPF